jgi:DNA-binding transcriptional LysR family regulator
VANDQEATVQLVLSGQFVGILPEHLAEPWVLSGKMVRVPVEQPILETPTYIVFRSKSKNLPVVHAIAQDISNAYTTAAKARTLPAVAGAG